MNYRQAWAKVIQQFISGERTLDTEKDDFPLPAKPAAAALGLEYNDFLGRVAAGEIPPCMNVNKTGTPHGRRWTPAALREYRDRVLRCNDGRSVTAISEGTDSASSDPDMVRRRISFHTSAPRKEAAPHIDEGAARRMVELMALDAEASGDIVIDTLPPEFYCNVYRLSGPLDEATTMAEWQTMVGTALAKVGSGQRDAA